ncbi:MAG: glycosyltransferase [Gammaproteobacteria bacterium]|nr:glycosyltransferase [Gammaproteobacteria bacterium]
MKILHVIPAFYPATYWGGPVFAVHGLCNALAAIPGVELRVLTTDTAGPQLSKRVKISEFPTRYPCGYDVFFTRRVLRSEIAPGILWRLWPMIRWADVIHLTGIYSFPTIPTLLACRMLRKPLVWSPRGALQATEEWKGAKKRPLKKIWEKICSAVMPDRCVLHVTSEIERATSLARLPNAVAAVIPNGTDLPESLPARRWRPDGALRLLFLGRLDPNKGIENLLEALGQIDDDAVRLDVYGTGDSRYSGMLVSLAHQLGLEGRAQFHGRVEAEEKTKVFLAADLCVMPSYSENFGMVVVEALAHGVPVIASTRTPWAMLEEKGCGWWVENSPEVLARAVQSARGMNLCEMGKRGREWVCAEMNWKVIANDMLTVYGRLVQAQP